MYIYINSSDTLSVLNTWLSAPEGFEKRDGGGILSASQAPTKYWIYTYKYTVSVLYIHKNGGMGNIQHKLRTNPTRRPHSHPGSHPASSAPSETGAGKRSTFTSANIFCKKRSFTCIYCVFLAFLCLLFFLCLQILGRNNKSVHNMSSVVESSTALASFPSGSSVLESCLAGALGRPCIFLMPV